MEAFSIAQSMFVFGEKFVVAGDGPFTYAIGRRAGIY